MLDSETRGVLAKRRWRQTPLTRPAMTIALALVLVVHALFVLMLWLEIQPQLKPLATTSAATDHALVVRLVSRPRSLQSEPPPPAPPTLPPPRVMTRRARTAIQQKPAPAALVTPYRHPAPQTANSVAPRADTGLFATDGSIRLPPASVPPAAKAKPATPADDRRIMQHDRNRMHYKATRFEKYFPPPNETAGGAAGRHVGDAIKAIAQSICDPKKSGTASNLLCGTPPLPPSPKDRDERLNLPPAALVDDAPTAQRPPLSSCIDEYTSNKPLSDGCPVNTPDLAFKAEMRICIDLFRAGHRLKTWCPLDTPGRAAAERAPQALRGSAGSP